MKNFNLYQWRTIEEFLEDCMKNNYKCAHCARYDAEHNKCMYSKQCFINDMAMYDDGDEC